jgi:ribulose-5-phosphate 4-epimerase/fuculose-1-phosphate aldolase
MPTVVSTITGHPYDIEEWNLRVDLAAAFRLAVHFNWHESVGNHFSAAVSTDGKSFLLNPKWKHFGSVRASDILLLNADDESVMEGDSAPDPTAWCIHGSVHRVVPRAKVILHCHPPYLAALCCLKDPGIKPIDQNTAKYFNRISIDMGFEGMANNSDEGLRIAKVIGKNDVLLMANHGVTVIGETVADAFENLYFLERSAKTLMLAYSTGQPLNIIPDETAESVAQEWEPFVKGLAKGHFEHLKSMLDEQDSSYRE